MPLRIGANTPSKLYLGNQPVSRVYLGTNLVWPPAPVLVAQGMDKSGAYNPGVSTVRQVPTFVPRANSVVTAAHELRASGAGDYLVSGSANFTGAGGSYSHRTYVYVNGAERIVSATVSGPGVVYAQDLLTLADGDLLSLWIWSSIGSRSAIAAASTALEIAPAILT